MVERNPAKRSRVPSPGSPPTEDGPTRKALRMAPSFLRSTAEVAGTLRNMVLAAQSNAPVGKQEFAMNAHLAPFDESFFDGDVPIVGGE
eukprot:2326748-Alexandrium_andersonii.AAC.1